MNDGNDQAPVELEAHRTATLGSVYLCRSLEELRASGSTDTLYRQHLLRDDSSTAHKLGYIAASKASVRARRVDYARSATLFAILAAEAYANQYLQSHLTCSEWTAADKLPTFEKYLLGPKLVRGAPLLERGIEPAQTLKQLLGLRTRLVHPKLVNVGAPRGTHEDPVGFDDFNPRDAARYIVAVADCAGWLLSNSQPQDYDAATAIIDQQRQVFLAYGERAAARLPDMTDDPQPDLLTLAWRTGAGWKDSQ